MKKVIMEIIKSINNLHDYISTSLDASNKYIESKVILNMSIILALKKIQSYEVEYFNKFEENGFACIVLEHLLKLPSSKTWGILGKELVSLLQYWLEAIRKHLISHSIHWWMFLERLLEFMKQISQKDTSLPDRLVEQTAECLLDISGNDLADPLQKLEILHCLNFYSAESSREIRFAMRNQFRDYFVKLSSFMLSCGYVPCQLAVMETLMRWLVPRQDSALRAAAARRWLQGAACPPPAVDIFLTRSWLNFNKDARDFLNAVNEPGDLITSVICRKLLVGSVVVVSGTEKQETWMDINTTGKCVSIMLEAGVGAWTVRWRGGGEGRALSADLLLLTDDNTHTASLYREHSQIIILVTTSSPLGVHLATIKETSDANRTVNITVSSNSDVKKLDKALRSVFGDKYQLLMDLENLPLSPLNPSTSFKTNNCPSSEEDTRFSHPAKFKRPKHSGYIVRSKKPAWNSPSTASTSSLAFLHEKLAALPRYEYTKEPVSVCVRPELSSVIEVNETDDTHSLSSALTSKFKSYGVCSRGLKKNDKFQRNCQSGDEVKRTNKNRQLSPTVSGNNAASCLLVATIGSAEESVINNTIERLSKDKNYSSDNIVDLLIQEALHSNEFGQSAKQLKTDINSGDINKNQPIQEENSETIDNTPFADKANVDSSKSLLDKNNCTIISKSTSTNDSNVEISSVSPVNYINVRERRNNSNLGKSLNKKALKHTVVEKHTIDVRDVEYFFNQGLTENSDGDVAISPTSAKKINGSSYKISESFDNENVKFMNEDKINPVKDFDNVEIIECSNSIIDTICDEIEKCTDNLTREKGNILGMVDSEIKANIDNSKTTSKQKKPKQKKVIKLKFNSTIKREKTKEKLENKIKKKKKIISEYANIQEADNIIHTSTAETSQILKPRITKKGRNEESEPNSKMSVILEADNAIIDIDDIMMQKENVPQNKHMVLSPEAKRDTKDTCNKTEFATPLIRRKRKLYSPKEEQTYNEILDVETSYIEEDNIALSELKSTKLKTPKSIATCYKELENERRRHISKPRVRKSKSRIPDPISPRTLKMNQAFEKLKENIENNEKIRTAKISTEMDVYNFTSDSEDEDFKKKIKLQKKTSTTILDSFKSPTSTRSGRLVNRVDYSSDKSSNDKKKRATTKRKKVVKKHKINHKADAKPIDLVDERMRQVTSEVLNTSLVFEKPIKNKNKEPELVLDKAPESEHIADDHIETGESIAIKTKANKKVKPQKKEKVTIMTEDRTESPLPGLIIESMANNLDDPNDSVTKNMLQKFKKIYESSEACINETNTTQNLLSDAEKVAHIPENKSNICQIEDITLMEIDDSSNNNNKTTKPAKSRLKLKRNTSKVEKINLSHSKIEVISNDIDGIIHICEPNDGISDKTIHTISITAHGNVDEMPPSPEMIEENVQPRDLELEDLNNSMKEYFSKLTAKLNEINRKTKRSNSSEKKSSPLMITSRFSPEEIALFSSVNKDIEYCTDQNKEMKVNESLDERQALVVSATRSPNSMQNYLPSRNNSSSDQNSEKSFIYRNNTQKQDITNEWKSPVVSVKRLSLSEIHKWLPPQNKTISDRNSGMSYKVDQINMKKLDMTNEDKSPAVSVKRLSLSEIHEQLPSQKNSILDSNLENSNMNQINKKHDTANKDKSPVVSVKRLSLSEVNNWIRSRRKSSSDKKSLEIHESVAEKDIKTKKLDNTSNDSVKPNKSLIEKTNNVLKLKLGFDKEKQYTENRSHIVDKESRVKDKSISGKSIEDEERNRKSLIFLIEIDGLFPDGEKKSEASPSNDNDKCISLNTGTKPNVMKSQDVNSSVKEQRIKRHLNNSRCCHDIDIDSPESTSTKIDSNRVSMKRKSSNLRKVKKLNTEVMSNSQLANIAESGQSVSSVNDWFRRNELTTSKDDTMRLTLVELIQNVTEKLDTSLDDINKNTSKNLVHLFVDAHKKLDTQKQERQDLYRQTASDLVKIIEERFADLDKRSQEMEADFMEQLRNRASEIILKDAQQKQVMVQIMKEDVEAVMEHFNKNKK